MASEFINRENEPEENFDLELENQALELDLQIKGGITFHGEETPPELYNQFLHNVTEFESLAAEPTENNRIVRTIFPADYAFPPADQMTDQEITEKLNGIKKFFAAENIELGLVKDLPERLIYTYIVEEVLPETPSFPFGADCRFTYVIDGCSGYCPGCFQREYCENSAGWK
ncbi:MAG: hypothetical protein H8E62_09830 [Planctomycetes bacterium]|nr:hypothetical protein [Planctomycetota bacterium]